MALLHCHLPTPLGDMVAVASTNGLCLLEFIGQQGIERELRQVEAARGGPSCAGVNAVLAPGSFRWSPLKARGAMLLKRSL